MNTGPGAKPQGPRACSHQRSGPRRACTRRTSSSSCWCSPSPSGLVSTSRWPRQKTTREFLMGNRNLSMIPVSISVFMSFISAILVLGNTAEVYLDGTRIFISCFGGGLAFLFTAFFFLPLFYPLKLTSSFEVS